MTSTPQICRRGKALAEAGIGDSPAKNNGRTLAQIKRRIEVQIDGFMKSVGYAEPAERTDERGWRYFNLESAEGRASVVESGGDLYLRVEAPIMSVPSYKDLIPPLMRELLEYNLTIPEAGRVGILDETVFAAITYPVTILADESIGRYIHAVMSMADGLDDVLLEKCGGQ